MRRSLVTPAALWCAVTHFEVDRVVRPVPDVLVSQSEVRRQQVTYLLGNQKVGNLPSILAGNYCTIKAMTKTDAGTLPDPKQQATLTVWPETAHILGLSKASAYEAARRGDIPTIKIGRRLLVPTAALRRMLAMDNDEPAGDAA